ncbi:unnamed protein product [Arctia plantaginis]|uniref:Apolipophorin-III n=1 Tax=Arctia plantaginis TaxID=874455 RepID=A0A8S1ALB6_ARCPL|nr:unnamed protein product [Arctia plantaginis]
MHWRDRDRRTRISTPRRAPRCTRRSTRASDSPYCSETYNLSTMAAKFIIFFAIFALSQASVVRRDAPAPTSSFLQDFEKRVADFQKTFSEHFQAVTNSKNVQDVNKALKDGSDEVLKQLSTLSSSIQSALTDANGKAKETLEQMQQNVQKTAEELKRTHPDVEKNANELRNKLQTAVQSTLQESQKYFKEVATNLEQSNEKLAPKIKEAFEEFVKQAEAVQKKVHDAATKQ